MGIAIWTWIAIAIAAVVVIILGLLNEKKRQQALSQIAGELGLSFSEKLPSADAAVFDRFPLANRGHSRRHSNCIVADSGQLRMVLFDYKYTTGGGKNSTTHRQTVVLVHAPELDLTQFTLHPESWLHRLGDMLGLTDIDFDDDPEFSKQFLLKGTDEQAIREFFTPTRRRQLMELPDACIEAAGDHFLFYRRSKRTRPADIKRMIEESFNLHRILLADES